MSKQSPSFEDAMIAASLWCKTWDNGELSDEVLADRIAELLETSNGLRGFFVISLSSESPLMDRLPDSIIFQLRESGQSVVDITVKNLAMSTAMEVHHKRGKDKKQTAGSERIKRRCIELLKFLDPHLVKEKLEKLLKATNGEGEYLDFLNRWNYDDEQKLEIALAINSIAEK